MISFGCVGFVVQRVLEGLKEKGHVLMEATDYAVVQAVFDRCRPRSNSSRSSSDSDDKQRRQRSQRCLVAVSDWRKRGAPSGF